MLGKLITLPRAAMIAFVCALAITCGGAAEVGKRPEVSFAPGVQLPAEAMVYRFKTTPVTEQRMRELIKLLDLPDPDTLTKPPSRKGHSSMWGDGIHISRYGGSYSILDKHLSLTVRNDGVISFISDAGNKDAPSEKDATAIARDFLKRSGLVPADAELQLIGVGGEGSTQVNDKGEDVKEVMEVRTPEFWIVRPDKTLERSMVEVGVCAGGRIGSLTLCMRTLEPGEKRPVKDEAEIRAAVVDQLKGYVYPRESYLAKNVFPTTAPDAAVMVESCRVAYTEPIFLESAGYAEPQYVVAGKATSKGRTWPFCFYIPALKTKFIASPDATPRPRGNVVHGTQPVPRPRTNRLGM